MGLISHHCARIVSVKCLLQVLKQYVHLFTKKNFRSKSHTVTKSAIFGSVLWLCKTRVYEYTSNAFDDRQTGGSFVRAFVLGGYTAYSQVAA